MLSEVSQIEEKEHMTYLIWEIQEEMIQMNLQNIIRLTELTNELIVAEGKDREKE